MIKMEKKEKEANGVQLFLRTVVTDPKGKVLHDSGKIKSKSFVIQFLEGLSGKFRNLSLNATARDGTEDQIHESGRTGSSFFQSKPGVNVADRGIVVGTGNTPVTNTDYVLDSQLTEGVGAGNITHNAQSHDAVVESAGNVDLVSKRSFTNNTGSTITVEEVGWYIKCAQSAGSFYFMIIRDVLGSPLDIPAACSLTVYYTHRTTV